MQMSRKTRIFSLLVLAIVILALISPYLTPYDPYATDIAISNEPPSADHWLGTDEFGRDVLSRTMVGAQISIGTALIIVAISSIVGTVLGITAGYFGGAWDSVIMTITDMFLAFPQLVIAIGIAGVLGGGIANAAAALTISNWMQYTRIARSSTLKEKSKDYVLAAKFAGLSSFEIIIKHILPNITDILATTLVVNLASMLVGLSGLSFLGIGAQIPTAEWGAMIAEGRSQLAQAPWQVLAPALAVVLVVLVFNQFGRHLYQETRENNV